jgi:hypothetical protein
MFIYIFIYRDCLIKLCSEFLRGRSFQAVKVWSIEPKSRRHLLRFEPIVRGDFKIIWVQRINPKLARYRFRDLGFCHLIHQAYAMMENGVELRESPQFQSMA